MAVPNCDCDNPHVVPVREAITPDGRKNSYFKCLNCQRDHVTTEQVAASVSVPSIAGAEVGRENETTRASRRAANIPENERCSACGGTGYGTTTTLTLKTCGACNGTGKKPA